MKIKMRVIILIIGIFLVFLAYYNIIPREDKNLRQVCSLLILKIASKNTNTTEAGVQALNTEQGSSTTQTLDTTKMTADVEVVEADIERYVPLPLSLLSPSLSNPMDASIAEFLKKPIALYNGVLQTGDVFGSANLGPYWELPRDILSLNPFARKLEGFMYFRGTIVFRVTVNANPFMQGLYALFYVPHGGANSNDVTWTRWSVSHTTTVVQRSQLPQVRLNLATQTAAELRIPWVSAYNAYTIPGNSKVGQLGYVGMNPLSSLLSGVTTSCGFTVWVHIEDLNLSIPTAPHSSKVIKRTKQSETSEQEEKSIGPITSGLRMAHTITRALSQVPILSDIASPTAWFLELSSNISSAFGWSKPRNADVQSIIVRDCMYGTNLIDSSDNSRSMAMSDKNAIEVLPGFAGTDIDELAFDAFLTKPTILSGIAWTTSQASGTLLQYYIMSPTNMEISTTLVGRTFLNQSPVAWLAGYFQYWRGSFRVTFHIIKTNMHSGRLAFVYSPYQTSAVSNYSASFVDSVYTWRHIVDIRTTNQVTLSIPFTSVSHYRPVSGTDAFSGSVQVFVVDELTAPSTCSSSVDILYEVSAEPGFEFAVPETSTYAPILNFPITTTPHSSNSIFSTTSQIEGIGNSTDISNTDHQSARKCIGEVITNLRQLLRRASPMNISTTIYNTGSFNLLFPFVNQNYYWSAGVINPPFMYLPDFYSSLNTIFALQRGGVRLKVTPQTNQGMGLCKVWLDAIPEGYSGVGLYGPNVALPPSGNPFAWKGNSSHINVDGDTRRGFEVQVPSYSRYHSRSNSSSNIVAGDTVDYAHNTVPTVCVVFSTYIYQVVELMRSGADDYNVGLFVSIPTQVPISLTD